MTISNVDLACKFGECVELSTIDDIRGRVFSRKIILMNGQLFDGVGVDMNGCVFYGCMLSDSFYPNGTCLVLPNHQANTFSYKNICTKHKDLLQGLDLSNIDLKGCLFTGFNFARVLLHGTDLSESVFNDGLIDGCDFEGANMSATVFKDIKIFYTDMVSANLSQSSFVDISFERCSTDFANIQGSTILKSMFRSCTFASANISDSKVEDTTFIYGYFNETDVSGTTFKETSFVYAKFEGADLRGAVFEDCEFKSCDFTGAKYNRYTSGLPTRFIRTMVFSDAD